MLLCPISGPMLGGAVTSHKHRRRAKVSVVELERSIEEVRGWPSSLSPSKAVQW